MGLQSITDFNLDSGGHCFFCLKQTTIDVKQEPDSVPMPKSKFQLYSLQYLSRYLKMDLKKVFNDEGHAPSHKLAKVERSRLKVELCEKCTSLNESFSERYRKLEKIEMEVGSCLGVIKETLLAADQGIKAAGQGQKVTESSLYPTRSIQILEIRNSLRNEAILKCSRKLYKVAPKVKIQNLTGNEIQAKPNRRTNFRQNINLRRAPKTTSCADPLADLVKFEEVDIKMDTDYSLNEGISSDDDNASNASSDHHSDPGSEDVNNARTVKIAKESSTAKKEPTPSSSTAAQNVTPKRKWSLNPETGKRKCGLCTKEFTFRWGFHAHYKSAHLKIRYECVICGKEFRNKKDYNRHHQSAHMGVRFKCLVCNKLFTLKRNLTLHAQTTSCGKGRGSTPKFKCSECKRTFARKDSLQIHMDCAHLNLRKHECDVCQMAFNTKSNVTRHKRTVHLGEKRRQNRK